MAQYIRPDGNITQTNFTGGYAEIDEASYSDSDFAYGANNTAATLEVSLTNPTDPNSSSGHVVRVRIAKTNAGAYPGTGGANVVTTVLLLQGSTTIATILNAVNAPDAWTQTNYTLSAAEADAITNYNDLRIRMSHTASGGSPANRRGAGISWAEMELPDALTPVSATYVVPYESRTKLSKTAEFPYEVYLQNWYPFAIATSGDDGQVERTGSVYPPDGSYNVVTTGITMLAERSFGSTIYTISSALLRWDTSVLPDTAIITAATLRMQRSTRIDSNVRNLNGEWYNWGASIGTEDYTEGSNSDAFSIPLADITTGINDFSLSNLSNIDTGGYTYLRLTISGGQPSGLNYVDFYTEDSTLLSPTLIVEWTIAQTVGQTYITPYEAVKHLAVPNPYPLPWEAKGSVFLSDTLITEEPILTTFTGADESPLSEGGNWTSTTIRPTSTTRCQRIGSSGTVASSDRTSTFSESVWATTFSADMQAWAQISTLPTGSSVSVWVRVQDENTASLKGYRAEYFPGSNSRLVLTRYVGLLPKTLATYPIALAVGDKICLQAIDSEIRVFYQKPGQVWKEAILSTNSEVTGSGRIGIGVNYTGEFTDFGGGAISIPQANLAYEVLNESSKASILPWEAVTPTTADYINPWESLQRLAKANQNPWEALANLSQSASSPYESGQGISGTWINPWEARETITFKQTGVARLSLESGGTPNTRTLHYIGVRARITNAAEVGTLRLRLYEGATPISAELETPELTDSFQNYVLHIADADAEDITSYSDLEIRMYGYSSAGDSADFEVAEVWLQIPLAGVFLQVQYEAPFEALKGLSATSDAPWENIIHLTAIASPTWESLISATSAHEEPYEALEGISATHDKPWEAFGSFSTTFQNPYENLLYLSLTSGIPYETLVGLSTTHPLPWESMEITGITADYILAWESLTRIATSQEFPYESLVGLTSSWLSPFENLSGLSSTFINPWEAGQITGIISQYILAWESLVGITAPQGLSWESLIALSRADTTPYETLVSFALSKTLDYETLLGLANSTELSWESLIQLSAAQLLSWESIQPLSHTTQAVYEALQGISELTDVPYDALGSFSATRILPWEALAEGGVLATYELCFEALGSFATTRGFPYESLVSGITRTTTTPWESLFGLNRTIINPFEAKGSFAQSFSQPWESLLGLSALLESQYEARGSFAALFGTPYENLQYLSSLVETHYESLLPISRTAENPWESLLRISRTDSLPYEAFGSFAFTSSLPWEATSISGVLATYELVYEAIQILVATAETNYESSIPVSRMHSQPYEALEKLAAQTGMPYETLVGLRTMKSLPWEGISISGVLTTFEIAYEALQALARTDSLTYETVEGLAALRDSVYESLQGIAEAAETQFENLQTTSGIRVVPYESLHVIQHSDTTPYEYLQGASFTANPVWEALGGISATSINWWEAIGWTRRFAEMPYESILPLSTTYTHPYEALIRIGTQEDLNAEVLAGIQLAPLLPWEARGWITQYYAGQYEALKALQRTTELPLEVLIRLALTGVLPWESVSQLVPVHVLRAVMYSHYYARMLKRYEARMFTHIATELKRYR